MTKRETLSMLKKLKRDIAATPIDRCPYCSVCFQGKKSPGVDCLYCIEAGIRTLNLAIEKIEEET